MTDLELAFALAWAWSEAEGSGQIPDLLREVLEERGYKNREMTDADAAAWYSKRNHWRNHSESDEVE